MLLAARDSGQRTRPDRNAEFLGGKNYLLANPLTLTSWRCLAKVVGGGLLLLALLLVFLSPPAAQASSGYHACTTKTSPAGTDGIFSLQTNNASCHVGRSVVGGYHRKWRRNHRTNQRVGRFACTGTLSAGGEGLGVRCATARARITWDAYLGRRLLRGGCGTVTGYYPDVEGGSGMKIVSHRAISCSGARHVMKQCIRQYSVRGWRARYDASLRVVMTNGRKRIVAEGVAGGGPHCAS